MKTVDHRGQPTLSQKGMFAVATVISMAFLALLALMVWMYIDLRHVAHDNRIAIRRLDRLQHPTREQFREDIKRGIERCLKEPTCAKLFPQLLKTAHKPARAHRAARAERAIIHSIAPVREAGGRLSTPAPQTSTRTPVHHKRHKRAPSGNSSVPSNGGGSGGGSGSQPASGGAVTITTSLPPPLPNPKLCTDTVRLNCP